MGRLLRDLQTTAADRTRFVQHPRLYRRPTPPAPASDWTKAALKWSLFGWLMGAIWGPVLLVMIIVVLALLG